MLRSPLLVGAGLLAGLITAPAPLFAQSDPAAQALIDQLRPRVSSGQTRGIRVPGEAPVQASPVAPMPLWNAPARPASAPSASQPPAPPPPQQSATIVRPATPARATTAPEGAAAVSITITFPSGSATLTADAERALAPLGRALSSPELSPYRFRIEGHTDTVGDPSMNQALSERRAAAVRNHLVNTYSVNPSRLEAVGFGAAQLLVPTPAQVPETRNRRVQVVNLGS
jgi:outer membrane protein OmpA-like peptidoglycan-associated protein